MSNKQTKTPNTMQTQKNLPISVPISADKKETTQLDLYSMSEEDLKLLKKRDPFMYYSIPAFRETAASNKEVDYAEALREEHRVVARKTRVSFEKDPLLLLEEQLGDELFVNGEAGGSEELDNFIINVLGYDRGNSAKQ